MKVFSVLNEFNLFPKGYEYIVRIEIPNDIKNILNPQDIPLDFLASGFLLPGISNSLINLDYKGAVYQVPSRSEKYGAEGTREVLSVSFKEIILDDAYYIHRLFTTWMDLIESAETGIGLVYNKVIGTAYVDFYSTTVEQIPDNRDYLGEYLSTIRLHRFYPVEVGTVNLDSSSNAIIQIPVTFHYDYWDIIKESR
jgi:hypothetical protein